MSPWEVKCWPVTVNNLVSPYPILESSKQLDYLFNTCNSACLHHADSFTLLSMSPGGDTLTACTPMSWWSLSCIHYFERKKKNILLMPSARRCCCTRRPLDTWKVVLWTVYIQSCSEATKGISGRPHLAGTTNCSRNHSCGWMCWISPFVECNQFCHLPPCWRAWIYHWVSTSLGAVRIQTK